jgi:hypothetical protein
MTVGGFFCWPSLSTFFALKHFCFTRRRRVLKLTVAAAAAMRRTIAYQCAEFERISCSATRRVQRGILERGPTTMTEFMNWLRVEMLRLRSFDWRPGLRRIRWLKDGVLQFSFDYPVGELAAKTGISEEELLRVVDSPSVKNEVEGKSFTISWKEGSIILSWLEEGISEWKSDINQHYYEEDGKFYSEFRMTDKVIYLDGTERAVKDTGNPGRIRITKDAFREAMQQVGRNSDEQE